MNKIADVVFTTQQIPLPDGQTPAGYLAWMTRDNQTADMQNLPATARTCQFVITAPGTYVVRVVRVDNTGASIGVSAESEPFEVTASMVEVPLDVFVTVGDSVATPAKVKVK